MICSAVERLEDRRLLAGDVRLIGITGNQQNPDYLDETLFEISVGENGSTDPAFFDGFEDVASEAPDTQLSISTTTGVTDGSGALRVELAQGQSGTWGFKSGNLVEALRGGVNFLTYDMTLNGIDLNGGSFGGGADTSFNGTVASDELAIVINTPSGGFIQRDFATAGAFDTLGQNATWGGVDGTRQIIWDLSKFTADGMSIADYIAANNATDARIWFKTAGGDTNGNTGPMSFYYDNIFLTAAVEQQVGDFDPFAINMIITMPFVPDTDAIGFNPEDGLLYRTSGASAYRDDHERIGYNDNHFMQTIDLFSPGLDQAGVFNANYQGDFTFGPYGLPAPRPDWLLPFERRTDAQTAQSFRQQGPDEYHAARDLTWSESEHLFYVADDAGIFKLTADGDSTFVGAPSGIDGGAKGITFFTIGGQRKLLISERDGPNLWTIDPSTGQTVGSPVVVTDPTRGPIPGILSLVEHPDVTVIYAIAKSPATPNDAFARELIRIDPVTGVATSLGSLGMHMADLAFIVEPPSTLAVSESAFVFETAPHRLQVTFDQDVDPSSLQPTDLSIQRLPGDPAVPATAVSYDAPTRTATFTLASAPLADGNYTATLAQGSVDGAGGGSLGSEHVSEFFVLAADANRDRKVDFQDLVRLAQNYNTSGKTFSEGNFNYDAAGNVDFQDLVMLAQRYNVTLDPPAAAAAMGAVVPVITAPAPRTQAALRRRPEEQVFNTTVRIQPPAPARPVATRAPAARR